MVSNLSVSKDDYDQEAASRSKQALAVRWNCRMCVGGNYGNLFGGEFYRLWKIVFSVTAKVDLVYETVYQLAAPARKSDPNMHQAHRHQECEWKSGLESKTTAAAADAA